MIESKPPNRNCSAAARFICDYSFRVRVRVQVWVFVPTRARESCPAAATTKKLAALTARGAVGEATEARALATLRADLLKKVRRCAAVHARASGRFCRRHPQLRASLADPPPPSVARAAPSPLLRFLPALCSVLLFCCSARSCAARRRVEHEALSLPADASARQRKVNAAFAKMLRGAFAPFGGCFAADALFTLPAAATK